jgi:hypothetical protein
MISNNLYLDFNVMASIFLCFFVLSVGCMDGIDKSCLYIDFKNEGFFIVSHILRIHNRKSFVDS